MGEVQTPRSEPHPARLGKLQAGQRQAGQKQAKETKNPPQLRVAEDCQAYPNPLLVGRALRWVPPEPILR